MFATIKNVWLSFVIKEHLQRHSSGIFQFLASLYSCHFESLILFFSFLQLFLWHLQVKKMSSKKEAEKAGGGKQPPVKKEKNDKKEKNEKKMEKVEKTGGPSEGKESKLDSTSKQQGKEQSKGKEQAPFTGSSPDPKGGKSSSKKSKPTGPTQQMVHIVEAQGPISLTPEDQKTLSSKQIYIGQPMRSGGFGMIYTATSGTGQGAKPMVAKVVELAGLAPTYFKEVSNWREMKHANVNPAVEIIALQQPDRMLIFMEPADFDLQDLVLKQPNWVGKKLAAQYYWQINRG